MIETSSPRGRAVATAASLALALVAALALAAPPGSAAAADATSAAPDTTRPSGQPPKAEDLLHGFDDLYRSTGTIAEFEITIEKADKTRTMKAKSWGEGEDKALIVIQSPPRDAGTATLKVDKNLWNYLPKISRTIRVPPAMMMNSWMGSDLTNDDLVKESSYVNDYDASEPRWTTDPPGWLVTLTPKPDVPGLWSRLEVVFETKHDFPTLVRYYDRKDRLARTMVFDEVGTLGGRLIPTRMTVIDEQQKGDKTILVYKSVEWNVQLGADTFSLSNLEKRH